MNHTTYEENIKFEKESLKYCAVAIKKFYPNWKSISLVKDKEQQLKGIDFLVELHDGTVKKVDVKVRRLSRIPWKTPEAQDILIEYKQGKGPGWAVSPHAETDDIIFVWPDLYTDDDYQYAYRISHDVCRRIIENKDKLARAGLLTENSAYNGYTIAKFCLVKIKDLAAGNIFKSI